MNLETISARDLDLYVDNPAAMIIDLRDRNEFAEAHIKGAYHIPYAQLERGQELPPHKDIVLYCDRGGVSLMAAKLLARKGYRAKSVVGGLHSYRGTNLVKEYW